DVGKRMIENMMIEAFSDSFPQVTGREVEIVDGGETPDYLALIDGRETGIELTRIYAETPDEYMEVVTRLAGKKEETFLRLGALERAVILVCYSYTPPIFDMRHFLDGSSNWIDLFD